jgi:putative membrane protein
MEDLQTPSATGRIQMKSMWMRSAVLGVAVCCLSGVMVAQDASADKKFVADAEQGSLFEINLAKLALQKTGDPNVKMFAERMVKDHTMLIEDMKPLARKMGVKTPTGPSIADRAKYEELKLKSGTSFDRAYVETMVKDHNDDLKTFIDEEQKTTNPQLKATVEKGEKVIREHTEMIDGIAQKGGIEVPPMPSGS